MFVLTFFPGCPLWYSFTVERKELVSYLGWFIYRLESSYFCNQPNPSLFILYLTSFSLFVEFLTKGFLWCSILVNAFFPRWFLPVLYLFSGLSLVACFLRTCDLSYWQSIVQCFFCLVNTASGIKIPNRVFPNTSWSTQFFLCCAQSH